MQPSGHIILSDMCRMGDNKKERFISQNMGVRATPNLLKDHKRVG